MGELESRLITEEYHRMKSRVRELNALNNISNVEYKTEFTSGLNNPTGFHVSMLKKVTSGRL